MAVRRITAGTIAGFAATAPMSVVMAILQRVVPQRERETLPPRIITARLTAKIGLREHIDHQEQIALTLANHFGYGAAAGAVYALLERKVPMRSMLKGTAYGLLVWTTSYLGILPVLGLLRPATEQRAARNIVMISAHVVWGSVLGSLFQRLAREGT